MREHFGLKFRSILIKFAVVSACVVASYAQSSAAPPPILDTINVSSPRPVADAVHTLQTRYGLLISYEEPASEYLGDLEDISSKVSKAHDKTRSDRDKQLLVPRSRSLQATFPINLGGNREGQRRIVQQILDQDSKNAGSEFYLGDSGKMLHIIPARSKNASGEIRPTKPLLDAYISLPATAVKAGEFLQQFCAALRIATGSQVYPGTTPHNMFADSRSFEASSGAPARETLETFLESLSKPGYRYAWSLYYQYGLGYVLNIDVVRTPGSVSPLGPARPKGLPLKKQPGKIIAIRPTNND